MSPRTAAPEVADLLTRISSAADDVRDAVRALNSRREQRRQLVVQAADEGISQRQIAAALGGGTGLVTKILAKPDPEVEE